MLACSLLCLHHPRRRPNCDKKNLCGPKLACDLSWQVPHLSSPTMGAIPKALCYFLSHVGPNKGSLLDVVLPSLCKKGWREVFAGSSLQHLVLLTSAARASKMEPPSFSWSLLTQPVVRRNPGSCCPTRSRKPHGAHPLQSGEG